MWKTVLYELLGENFAQHIARVLLCWLSVVSLFRSQPCLCFDFIHVLLQVGTELVHFIIAAMLQDASLLDRSI
jgi:hypothetical protein